MYWEVKMEKKTTLEKWIETRLFNLKRNKKRIDIEFMIAEISGIFKIPMTDVKERNLKKKIQFINNRVAKQYQRYTERVKELSRELMVPVDFIHRWYAGGLDINKSKNTKIWLRIVRERDFYDSCKKDTEFSYIPKDMNTCIIELYLNNKRFNKIKE